MQDHRKLKVFSMADDLVADIYEYTATFPKEERYGLQSQIRRAAVSVPTNIVEGCTRRSGRELAQFISVALGSASEVRYLLELSQRLGFDDFASQPGPINADGTEDLDLKQVPPNRSLVPRYDELVRALSSFLQRLEQSV
jgi:four helix bundle protein